MESLTTLAVAITVVVMATALPTNKVHDARCAMGALITGRSLPVREDEPEFPTAVAKLAWDVAEAMEAERSRRSRSQGRGK